MLFERQIKKIIRQLVDPSIPFGADDTKNYIEWVIYEIMDELFDSNVNYYEAENNELYNNIKELIYSYLDGGFK